MNDVEQEFVNVILNLTLDSAKPLLNESKLTDLEKIHYLKKLVNSLANENEQLRCECAEQATYE